MKNWDESLKPIQELIMQPIIFNDLIVTLVDALPAPHDRNWFVETHRHPWFEFNFVSEGSLYTTLKDTEFLAAPGQYYLIPPGAFHSHRHNNHQGDSGFCLRWQFDTLEASTENNKLSKCARDIINNLSISRAFGTQMNAMELIEKAGQVKTLAAKQAIFIQWLVALYESWTGKNRERQYQNDHEKLLVQQAIMYLSEYYANDLNVQEVTNSLHISYRHLARIFKHVTGVTIIEKLQDIRINKAKKLLKETGMPIREIALTVGFSNEYYFNKIFTRHSYITPSKFRSKFRE